MVVFPLSLLMVDWPEIERKTILHRQINQILVNHNFMFYIYVYRIELRKNESNQFWSNVCVYSTRIFMAKSCYLLAVCKVQSQSFKIKC